MCQLNGLKMVVLLYQVAFYHCSWLRWHQYLIYSSVRYSNGSKHRGRTPFKGPQDVKCIRKAERKTNLFLNVSVFG